MNDSEVRFRLFGGLGNQLFQYHAGTYFAKVLNRKLSFDARWIDSGYGHIYSDLRDFRLAPEIRWVTKDSDGSIDFRKERIKTVLAREFPRLGKRLELFVPKGLGFFDPKLSKDISEVRGYFQTSEYASRLSLSPGTLELVTQSAAYFECQEFLLERPFLAVHVRGGDYLHKNKIYKNLSLDYYERAIALAIQKVGIDRVIVFSDDLGYAKQLLGCNFNLEFLPAVKLRASEELVLMSLASAFVIANSTFSYWAALTSGTSAIFAPNKWLHEQRLSPDFYPSGWDIIQIK
jgi:hypothetical protein